MNFRGTKSTFRSRCSRPSNRGPRSSQAGSRRCITLRGRDAPLPCLRRSEASADSTVHAEALTAHWPALRNARPRGPQTLQGEPMIRRRCSAAVSGNHRTTNRFSHNFAGSGVVLLSFCGGRGPKPAPSAAGNSAPPWSARGGGTGVPRRAPSVARVCRTRSSADPHPLPGLPRSAHPVYGSAPGPGLRPCTPCPAQSRPRPVAGERALPARRAPALRVQEFRFSSRAGASSQPSHRRPGRVRRTCRRTGRHPWRLRQPCDASRPADGVSRPAPGL